VVGWGEFPAAPLRMEIASVLAVGMLAVSGVYSVSNAEFFVEDTATLGQC